MGKDIKENEKLENKKMEDVKEKIKKLLEDEEINVEGEQNLVSSGLGCGISGC